MTASVPSFIEGRHLDCSGERFAKFDPATGSAVAWLHKGRQSDVDAAMNAARRGLGRWSETPAATRLAILTRAAALMREHASELAILEAHETGRPFQGVLVSSVHAGADCLEDFANAGALLFDAGQPAGTSVRTVHEPLGVCVGIGSAHRPLYAACAQAAPALAAGNTVVYKPSERAPAGAVRLAQILSQAGLPPGAFNVVQGKRGTAAMLAGHRDAALVMSAAGPDCGDPSADSSRDRTDAECELPAPSTLIVFDDADLAAACKACVSAFDSHGATGNAGARVFVQRRIADRIVAGLTALAGRLRVGRATERAIDVGPLTDGAQLEQMLQLVNACVERGASLCAGGHRLAAPDLASGFFLAPTVLANCTDDMKICAAGWSGPLLAILPFDDEGEVVKRANVAMRGGAAAVFTRDVDRALRVADGLKTQTAWIDTFDPPARRLPRDRMDMRMSAMPGHWADLLRLARTKRIHIAPARVESARIDVASAVRSASPVETAESTDWA